MLNNARFRYQMNKLKNYLAIKTEMIQYQAVIREVASAVDRSWIYYLMLLSASLIALLGLLTNSVAVIIGAMLISPLMSPIISSGLALTIGDLPLARRAYRTIFTSVVLTILLTAFITILSPLKEPTTEILARVRPNIYDLIIAALSGIVGAVALCTKRNYLITATGVAVATAVIPPLSVAGYGLGTGQFMIALGGFFLFFTNFVAIVLTSDLVFFILGFRTSHVETIQYSPRKRILIIAGMLLLISIPLVYTLVADLQKVKTHKRIERVLKKHLNKDNFSRMTGYSFKQGKKLLNITTTVNTVSYIPKTVEQGIEAELQRLCTMPVDLHLEQIIMASEKIAVNHETSLMDRGKEVVREEPPLEVRAKTVKMVATAEQALTTVLSPFTLADTRLSFASGGQLLLTATLHRDWPVSPDEQVLLARHLEQTLGQPLDVSLKTEPMLPPLTFTADGALSVESIKSLASLKQLPGGLDRYHYLLQTSGRYNRKHLATLQKYLLNSLQIPAATVAAIHQKGIKAKGQVTLRIVRL